MKLCIDCWTHSTVRNLDAIIVMARTECELCKAKAARSMGLTDFNFPGFWL